MRCLFRIVMVSILMTTITRATPPAPVPFGDVKISGELGTRLLKNFDRLEEEKYQPDHVFTDVITAANMRSFAIDPLPAESGLSDHAPLVIDVD